MDEPLRKRFESIPRDATLEDLVDWCLQRGLDPSGVVVTGGHLRWESPLTDDERQARDEYRAKQEQRTLEWELATYERLNEKFK